MPPMLTPAESDPVEMGWMTGSPPPPDKLVRFADMSHYRFPQTRWSFANFRQLVPTVNVRRGAGAVAALPRADRDDLDGVVVRPLGADSTLTWAQSLDANYTDAILVLHRGAIVYERYFGVMQAHQPHMAMSVTKSLVGTLGEMLVADGRLDPAAPVTRWIPELTPSAWGDASVRQVLDMTTGVDYSEDYSDPAAGIFRHATAGGVFPRPADYSGPQHFYDYLCTVPKQGEHGQAFAYKTVNTDVLGWLIRRASGGRSLAELLSERLWQPLGCEEDACMRRHRVRRRRLQCLLARHGARRRDDAAGRLLQRPAGRAEGGRGRDPPGRQPIRLRARRLRDAAGLELPLDVVDLARRPRRLRRARRPRPGDLCRSGRRDGDRAFRLAPAGGQRPPRPDLAARLQGRRGPLDALRLDRRALHRSPPEDQAPKRIAAFFSTSANSIATALGCLPRCETR